MTDKDAAIEKVADALPVLTAEVVDLRTEIGASNKRRDREVRMLLWVLAGVAVFTLVMAVMVALLMAGRAQAKGMISRTEDTAARIEDCTTAGNPCYDAAQKRSAGVVAEILRRGALQDVEIAGCGFRGTEAEYRACVATALPELYAPPPPAQ